MSGDFLAALYFPSLLLSTAIKEILSLCKLFRNLKTEALFATTFSTLERIRGKIKAQRQEIVFFSTKSDYPQSSYPASRRFLSCRFFFVVFLRLSLPLLFSSTKKTTKKKQHDKKPMLAGYSRLLVRVKIVPSLSPSGVKSPSVCQPRNITECFSMLRILSTVIYDPKVN